jgi:hypothetical protein
MDPNVFASQPHRVDGSGKVDILNTEYLDAEYETVPQSDLKATPTGFVTIAQIVPKKDKTLPSFILRWDSNPETVDVDIYLDGKNKKDFWDRPGYCGHHPKRIKGEGRKFEVNITIPERPIFKGVVNVGLLISVNLKVELELSDTGIRILSSNLPQFLPRPK